MTIVSILVRCFTLLFFLASLRCESERFPVARAKFMDHMKNKRKKRSDEDYRISDDENLWELFTTESFSWVEDVLTNSNPTYFNYSGYNSFEPFKSELHRLEEKYDFVTVEVFGKTHENRDLLALHINKGSSEDVVFLNSLIHAREWVVGCVTMNIIHRLLEYNTSGAHLLLNNFHFIIVPVANPDGYEYSHTKNRMWRKNREPTPEPGCYGADVNRNFMYGYKSYVYGDKEGSPCSETYPARKALSTKEANALNFLLFKYRPKVRYYIDYHTFGNLWTNAYGAHYYLPKNERQLKRYRTNVEKSFMDSLGIKWKTGGVYDIIYECHGIVVDHVHYYITPIAYTVEVGDPDDEFTAPDTRIETYVISQWLALVSQLRLLHSEIQSGQYMKDRTMNWRRTSMQKRTVVYKRDREREYS